MCSITHVIVNNKTEFILSIAVCIIVSNQKVPVLNFFTTLKFK